MGDCCASQGRDAGRRRRARCPGCAAECADVSARTVDHHVKAPWRRNSSAEAFFFCDNPDCDVVYLGDGGTVISRSDLRSPVGAEAYDALLCHCFGVSRADFAENPSIRDFVLAKTKAGLCSCETSNPSGRCCLKSFPGPKD